MLFDRARLLTRDMPKSVTACSSDSTCRLNPKCALLAQRKSVAVIAGSLAMMASIWEAEADSSFKVRIKAWATSDITGNLADSKKAVNVGMKSPGLNQGLLGPSHDGSTPKRQV